MGQKELDPEYYKNNSHSAIAEAALVRTAQNENSSEEIQAGRQTLDGFSLLRKVDEIGSFQSYCIGHFEHEWLDALGQMIAEGRVPIFLISGKPRHYGGGFLNTGKAALTAACKSNAIGGLFNMLCLGLTLWNWLNHKAWTANGVLDTGGGRSR